MADTLNKSDLVAKIAAETNQSQATVASVVDSFFNVVAESVGSGTKVAIPGWISFEQISRAARAGRNPATGEQIQKPADKVVKMTIAKALKDSVNG